MTKDSAPTRLLWFLLAGSGILACGGAAPAPKSEASNSSPPSTSFVPLTDLENLTYLGFSGGLYFNGSDQVPADHDSVGKLRGAAIRPLDSSGNPSPSGKIVLISLGMSNTTDEWCAGSSQPPCTPQSFMAKAAADSHVNHLTLVILDGAFGGQDAKTWTLPTSPNFDRVRDSVLSPNGVSEKQVEAAWVKEADAGPTVSLPSSSADAFALEKNLGEIVRAMKVRWPNLQQVFLSSRIYAGYATTNLNPEPYAYESGFSVKWLVQAQIEQMRGAGAVTDADAGDLNYLTVAPWIVWGPYLWANGRTPRSDGLTWAPSDFQSDGTHPGPSGVEKVANLLMSFFLNSPYAPWFRPM